MAATVLKRTWQGTRSTIRRIWATRRRRQLLGLGVVAFLACALRVAVFELGWLAGPQQERYADLVLAGLILLLGLALTAGNTSAPSSAGNSGTTSSTGNSGATGANGQSSSSAQPPPSSGAAGDISLVGAALGAALASVGVVQLVFPGTPYQAVAPACRGVSVVNSPFLAQTQAGGVNARSGASAAYPQVQRYGGGCTLGFVGYCIGQEVPDEVADLIDTRWLIVDGKEDQLVAAAKLADQSPLSDLGDQPHEKCESLGGVEEPSRITFEAAEVGSNEVSLTAESEHAAIVGYGVRVLDPIDGYEYSLIGLKDNQPDFAATWAPNSAAASLPNGTGTVRLGAAPCLATDHAAAALDMYEATFVDGVLTSLKKTDPEEGEERPMRRIACSGTP